MMLRVFLAKRLGSVDKILMNEVYQYAPCILCGVLRNVNEKRNLKRGKCDKSFEHFTEHLGRIRGAYRIFRTTKSQ